MPFLNETLVGLNDKDKFNGSHPRDDAQFIVYVTNPVLPLVLASQVRLPPPSLLPRADLVAAFFTGINTPASGNINQPPNVMAAEMLRLNTGIPAKPAALQSNLGFIGGDNAGFPNGRRPGDDVVDIIFRLAMGKLIAMGLYGTPGDARAGNAPLTDGAFTDARVANERFPYLKTPLPGSPNQPR